ncbi:disulfide bond formation protein B [Suttonella sp. R2A3]|uniref:disulfide bond formation protein B n=1 Tax=Suttonella sp. R2A3 TaxID=2908648 RepID=UPI001F341AEC|nr:disulfide bond formation protein B [Suttonella sp. R2A3]UJF23878.1 disulfide bond formation protein B [Suttonella sp. R2A3]
MHDKTKRLTLLAAAVICWLMIAFAYFYLEKTLYLNPCPLCMMQRLAFAVVGLMFFLHALWWPKSGAQLVVMKTLKYLSIFFGIGLAARHIQIQNLPAGQTPACGLDFYGVIEQNGFLSGLWQSMQGTGDCATRDLFMGLTIPTWSIALFFVLLVVAIFTDPKR